MASSFSNKPLLAVHASAPRSPPSRVAHVRLARRPVYAGLLLILVLALCYRDSWPQLPAYAREAAQTVSNSQHQDLKQSYNVGQATDILAASSGSLSKGPLEHHIDEALHSTGAVAGTEVLAEATGAHSEHQESLTSISGVSDRKTSEAQAGASPTALSQPELEGYLSALDASAAAATQTSLVAAAPTPALSQKTAAETQPASPTPHAKPKDLLTASKALVMGLRSSATPLWLLTVPKDWNIIKYIVDDPTAEFTVPRNEGREAMVYLTYIIDNYDSLPDYIVFAHGEYQSWHQPEPFTHILKALNLSAVDEHRWVNLRCDLEPSCSKTPVDSWAYTDNWSWWSFVLRAMFGHIYQETDSWYPQDLELIEKPTPMRIPYSFASPCCAQFAVSKAAVQSKPRAFWERAREPLLQDKAEWAPNLDAKYADSWHLGVGYERLWHYFFGLPPHVCLEEEYCRSVIYQDRIKCDGTSRKWGKDYEQIKCDLIE